MVPDGDGFGSGMGSLSDDIAAERASAASELPELIRIYTQLDKSSCS